MSALLPIPDPGGAALAIRRCILSSDHNSAALLSAAAIQRGWPAPERAAAGIVAAIPGLESGPPPALLIIDLDTEADPLAALAILADHCLAQTRVLAIGSANDVPLFRALRDAGVSDYLPKPLAIADVALALARLDAAPDPAIDPGPPPTATLGRLLVVIGARGGCGVTTMATSLAWAMAQGAEQRTILVDLDLHFGTAGLAFGLEPSAGLAAMLATPDRLDDRLVAAALQPAGARLGIIAANLPFDRSAAIDPQAATALLAELRGTAEWVVADLPRGLDGLARQLLRTADAVMLVAPSSLEGLRDAARLMAYLRALRAGAAPLLVVNGAHDGQGLGQREFESHLGEAVAAWIPTLPAAALAAAAHGQPLAAVSSIAANPFDALASRITGKARTPAASRPGRWPWRR